MNRLFYGDNLEVLRDYIADGRDQYGMQTFDQHLADLVQSGEVTFDTAMAAATNPSDFELKMRMFSRVTSAPPSAAAEVEPVAATAAAPAGGGMEGITNSGTGFDFYQK